MGYLNCVGFIVNYKVVNMKWIFFGDNDFILFRYIFIGRIVRLYDSFMVNFLRNRYIVFYNGCVN